jgi:tetratricopeptide (TPR) repeat protein
MSQDSQTFFPTTRRSDGRRTQAMALGLAFLALAAAFLMARWLEGHARDQAKPIEPIFFPRVEILRPALLGFTGLAADLTWIRCVQYFGTRIQHRERFPQVYQLVDMATSLDPHFLDAYVYGGLFLVIAKQYPNAIALYQKGIAANPTVWQLPHDLARLYFLELHDYTQALHWFEITARLPGRPEYVPRFIARLYATTGHRETALELWRAMRDSATNAWVRELAEREIAKLEHGHTQGREGRR